MDTGHCEIRIKIYIFNFVPLCSSHAATAAHSVHILLLLLFLVASRLRTHFHYYLFHFHFFLCRRVLYYCFWMFEVRFLFRWIQKEAIHHRVQGVNCSAVNGFCVSPGWIKRVWHVDTRLVGYWVPHKPDRLIYLAFKVNSQRNSV